MKIENYEDFVRLVELLPDLLEFPLVQVIMTLRSGLNRGCKCNKEKKKKQLEQVYGNAIEKYKDKDFFKKILLEYLNEFDSAAIEFLTEKQTIFYLKK